MSAQPYEDEVVARLRTGAPGYPDFGPDAGHMLFAARRALHRRRFRLAWGGVAAVMAALVGLTAAGPITVPGVGTFVMPGAYDIGSILNQGEPPVFPRQQQLDDVARLEQQVLPLVEELELTRYINETGPWGRSECRVFTWSHGAFQDPDCANPNDPELPFDAASDAAFAQVSDAIRASGVNVYRIEKGGWGPGTSFHLRDPSWLWNWYYSYVPGTPADAPKEVRTETPIGTRLQVHITGDWWLTVEPDD